MASKTINLYDLSSRLRNLDELVHFEGGQILEEAGRIGVESMRATLEASITLWGEYRFNKDPSQGVSEGRRDDDIMYQAIDAENTDEELQFGWINQYEEYFGIQESLHNMDALGNAKLNVLDEMPRLIKNARARIRRAKKAGKI